MAALHLLTFPGAIYDADDNGLNVARPRLTQADLDSYPHRSLVIERDRAPVARVCLLANDATPDEILSVLMIKAITLMLVEVGLSKYFGHLPT